MKYLESMVGKTVDLDISGSIRRTGVLIDYGIDVVVIYDGSNYLYVPFGHIRNVRQSATSITAFIESEQDRVQTENDLSYHKILLESQSMLCQIFLSKTLSISGYVTHVYQDYFVFSSPVHHTLFIPNFHLKWLIPYPEISTAHTHSHSSHNTHPSPVKFARTFEEQLKRMIGSIVAFDLGSNPEMVGLLQNVRYHTAEVVTANQKQFYWNLQHIKTAHFADR
ncbi:hypothetical protein AN963_15250 [Brevibacillus choshinensis]|uniref:DUF2642 domain-containing protein n=1 Tax=Brevibacillus choshinensis TaxID=54911 RepID=A0ABR5N6U2_BRECH|nr:hypothetical protein [Brevibacillus choshinensis]KQL46320.1 hypothetical protein AN963_15250 [Brevibacillus choshinensis]